MLTSLPRHALDRVLSGGPGRALSGAFACLVAASPLAAQNIAGRTVVYGRVEDALTREPIAAARVFSPDSTASVFTDSLGTFGIALPEGDTLAVYAEQFGYLSQRFDLAADAPSRLSVLLLEPAPIEIQGFEVVEEGAVTELLDNLSRRRNFYEGVVGAYDRSRIERFMPVGSVWDFVRQRIPEMRECSVGWSGLCVRGRVRTPQNPDPQIPVLVCVDGWRSFGAVSEMESLDVQAAALVEIYGRGRGGVRVYTAGYLASQARKGQTNPAPLSFGC